MAEAGGHGGMRHPGEPRALEPSLAGKALAVSHRGGTALHSSALGRWPLWSGERISEVNQLLDKIKPPPKHIQRWKKEGEREGNFLVRYVFSKKFQTSETSIRTWKWKNFLNISWIWVCLANYLFRKQICEFSNWEYPHENTAISTFVLHASQWTGIA